MKRICTILFIFLGLFSNFAFAQENSETITLQGKTEFNWLDISQIERDTIIQNYKNQ